MAVLAASFLAYFALLVYCAFSGPEEPGILAEFDGGRMRVRKVVPGSPAARAGLDPGDVVAAAGGQPVRTRLDWMAVTGNSQPGVSMHLEVERRGESRALVLTPRGRSFTHWRARGALVGLLLWGVRLATLLAAFLIAWRRPYDPVARVGAWFLASAAVSSVVLLNGMVAAWRQLPAWLGACLAPPALSTLVLSGIFFTFFALFPRGLFRARRLWAAAWIPALVPLRWFTEYLYRAVYRPERATGIVPDWFVPAYAGVFLLYLAGGIAALGVNYRRLEDLNQRRRVRLLAAAAVAGWLAVLPLIAFDWLGAASSHTAAFFSSPWSIVAAALFLACVLALSYAILRHRVFGIRVMLRLGLRYALARGLVISLVPAVAVLLLADLAMHAEESLASVLGARGWIYVVAAGLAFLAQARRRQWLEAIDRRFFREHYDAQKLLADVVRQVHRAGSLGEAAPLVVAQLEAALHPEFVALLARDPEEMQYRTLAAAPAGHAPPPVPGDSRLMGLLRVLGKPLDLSPTTASWLKEQLPPEDTDFVRQARIELLVPICLAPGSREALLAVGSKRSEEPYGREDRELLVAVATGLALLVERPGSPPRLRETLQECPQCGACYDSGVVRCAREGSPLTRRAVPRLLAARYRLERRLGRGGMGTVYEAHDLALQRRVAAKLIHEELLASAEAAERFRREARAAAGFSHPNIVTVHDFGVEAGAGAFLVMELLEGRTLREELRRSTRLAPERALEILRGVCEAVDTAHGRQLIHRDLKPENIFLARGEAGDTAKVLDFGIAKPMAAQAATAAATQTILSTETGVRIGTPQYMAPEQLLGGEPHPAWDLWALAVVAYEMLAGAHPFQSEGGADWHRAVLSGRFAPIDRGGEFFARALSPEPERRPHTARELWAEFQRAVGR